MHICSSCSLRISPWQGRNGAHSSKTSAAPLHVRPITANCPPARETPCQCVPAAVLMHSSPRAATCSRPQLPSLAIFHLSLSRHRKTRGAAFDDPMLALSIYSVRACLHDALPCRSIMMSFESCNVLVFITRSVCLAPHSAIRSLMNVCFIANDSFYGSMLCTMCTVYAHST